MRASEQAPGGGHPRRLDALWIFASVAGLRLLRLDHTPQWDEMFHVMAAQSFLSDGTLSIAEGTYSRAATYTLIVALFSAFGGDPLIAARVPALLSGAGLVTLLYWWTAREAGRAAGVFAAVGLALLPLAIQQGQMARFYSLHALCFLGVAMLVFDWSRGGRPPWLQAALLAGLSGLTLHLQLTTLIGGLGLATWLVIRHGATALGWLRARRATPVHVVVAAVFGLLGIGAAWATGLLAFLLERFLTGPVWSRQNQSNPWVYHDWLMGEFPWLWIGLPVAVALAWRRAREFTLLCTVVLVVGLVVHSLAGPKARRFVLYLMPFFFAIHAMAIAEAIALLLESARGTTRRVLALMGIGALALAAAWFNPGVRIAVDMFRFDDAGWYSPSRYRGYADWDGAAPALAPWVDEADVVAVSAGVKGLYFLGRADVEISLTNRAETDTGHEFGRDPRTGVRLIATGESMRRLIREHPRGLVVIEMPRWRVPFNVPDDVADVLEGETERVPLSPEYRLLAFQWGFSGALEPEDALR